MYTRAPRYAGPILGLSVIAFGPSLSQYMSTRILFNLVGRNTTAGLLVVENASLGRIAQISTPCFQRCRGRALLRTPDMTATPDADVRWIDAAVLRTFSSHNLKRSAQVNLYRSLLPSHSRARTSTSGMPSHPLRNAFQRRGNVFFVFYDARTGAKYVCDVKRLITTDKPHGTIPNPKARCCGNP